MCNNSLLASLLFERVKQRVTLESPLPQIMSDWCSYSLARRYGTGDVNITYPVSPFYLTPSAAWTLNKHTYTQSVGDYSANSVDDSILIINFSRYGYQPQTYGDTNTGDMYIHGIRIAYSTN